MVKIKTSGVGNAAAEYFEKYQLEDRGLWKRFVDVFRIRPDAERLSWQGEFWGKMLRGGVLVYEYTRDEELYRVLTETVEDMITTADADGRVSSYERDKEFCGWDMWCRKYVILACEYYLGICKDEVLASRITEFIKGCADYIIARVGNGEEKIEITDTSSWWRGLNSSSILEPIVRLYRLTGEKRYLDFAEYIVNEGGAKEINVFELAYKDEISPYQYGVSKAYEMISCFEGLLEYYYVTGIEKYKTAVINFANAIIRTELSVIGSSGITHELFDYTAARQTVEPHDVLQETCVTVTWMKFASRLLGLTGDSRYADCIEKAFYNAYLGTLNTDQRLGYHPHMENRDTVVDTVMPTDSYSPLRCGKRGDRIGGFQFLTDNSYYGCCACISSAGVGVFMNSMVTADGGTVTINFFENGVAEVELDGGSVRIEEITDYPRDGKITVNVKCERPMEFELKIRVPDWTGNESGYAVYKRVWSEDTVTLDYKMEIRTQYPMKWESTTVYIPNREVVYHNPDDDNFVALMRGPLTLAVDSRCGKAADSVFDFEPVGELADEREIVKGVPCLVKMKFKDRSGESFSLVDYASAGRDWQTDIAAWLRTK